jgi:hypothetical protein
VDGELKKFGPLPFRGPLKIFSGKQKFYSKMWDGGGGWVGRRFLGKNVPKIIFAIMRGSKYFSDHFRPQFQNTLRNSSIPGTPPGKLGPLSSWIFWPENCLSVLDVSSRNGWINVIEIIPKVYVR